MTATRPGAGHRQRGSALRLSGPVRASLITSVLFGLWHIVPTLHTMRDNRAVAWFTVHPRLR